MKWLADIFRSELFAPMIDLHSLSELIDPDSWLANEPWTAQKHRPLSQAVQANQNQVVRYLLPKGAAPSESIGDLEEEITIDNFAKFEWCRSDSIR